MKKPEKVKRNGVTYNLSKSGDYVNPSNPNDILTWLIIQDLLSSRDSSTDFGWGESYDSGSSHDSDGSYNSGSSHDSDGGYDSGSGGFGD